MSRLEAYILRQLPAVGSFRPTLDEKTRDPLKLQSDENEAVRLRAQSDNTLIDFGNSFAR